MNEFVLAVYAVNQIKQNMHDMFSLDKANTKKIRKKKKNQIILIMNYKESMYNTIWSMTL
jgi:hypothetical protein